MAKIKIKNTQLAKATGLDKFKKKVPKEKKPEKEKPQKAKFPEQTEEQKPRRIRAKAQSAFAQKEEPAAASIAESTKLAEVGERETPTEQPSLKEEKLGPTGKHIKDLLTPTAPPSEEKIEKVAPAAQKPAGAPAAAETVTKPAAEEEKKEIKKGKKVREFKDLKPAKRQQVKSFDARDRQGLSSEEEERWRKKRAVKQQRIEREAQIIRPTKLKIRLPISLKDLADKMKLKASELIQKLFLLGMTFTLNDLLDEETLVQYIGNEFGCEITVDTTEEKKIQITAQTIREEISTAGIAELTHRAPVVTFMGHVDHGKTSLIDAIRKSNITAGEAGAITQHIGAFRCKTPVGDLTVLDTPGHEAFSAMRARGAEVTDIVVLVVAGDEGLKEQTLEAIQHAKAAGVTIVVAINKSDKPNFNAETVYRQLSEINLLPEVWGGQTITVNTSTVSGKGIPELLEMLALQSEVLELKANPHMRARGTVLESEMHKGHGPIARVLVQNGTLRVGDALVFERHWARVKTMFDEHGNRLEEAGPSIPVEITGLSGLPSAGDPFIVVKNEKEAQEIIEARVAGSKAQALKQKKAFTLDKMQEEEKKILKIILRGDVQGSVEALKNSILKIESKKANAEVIFSGVGEISESDIQLAAASNAIIIGFHTRIESHAEPLIKELGVGIRLHEIIYHAIEDVKNIMLGMLDKVEEEREMGTAEVKALFKASQLGVIAGCQVTEGVITRNHMVRVFRNNEEVWKGGISSLKRVKEDVKEVKKGLECGILLNGYNDFHVGDILKAYEIVYLTQEL